MMHNMKLQKIAVLSILSATFALGNTLVFAQSTTANPPEKPAVEKHFRHSPEEMYKMREHHLHRLHDHLKITASQDAAWQAFEAAYLPPKDMKMPPKPGEENLLTAPERIQQRLAFLQNEESRLTDQLDKTKALYAQLNADQQAILNKDDMFKPFMGFGKRPPMPRKHHEEK